MNTNQLKKFAQEARRKLLEQVGAKLSFVLTTDSAELREKTEQLKQLREELGRTPKEQLIEKVAYTWFNRLMALRFMDSNDYQPLGVRIITPKDGYIIPEILDEAKRGNIPEELKITRQKIYDLLDNKIPSTNPQNEAYKELLIAACNHLHTTFPFLFEKISDYTELLLPDDLTSDFSILTDVRNGMPVDDCKNVEIIGWLYQFYISEEKDRLINAKKRYNANEIAPVTQLFTPKWIVQYMVDNTLGQLWKETRPKTNITKYLEFYIKPENESILPKREIKSPEEISFFDPCVGSAHILCYAYDVFHKIYEEEGYNNVEISELIITKNLFGIDIDDRAAQLASFALMMKGRQYNRRFLKKGIIPNITAFQNYETNPKFVNAKTVGSLVKISFEEADKIKIDENSVYTEQQKQFKRQAVFLATKYDVVVTNPPYLNSAYMTGELKQFVEKDYNSTKSDLFACMLIQATELTKDDGFIGYISPYVWMFISSYEKLREHIISKTTISSLIQLEYNAFEPACVPVATFTLRNAYRKDYYGSYIKLSDFTGHQNQAPKTLEAIHNNNCGWFYTANQKDFLKIPSSPIGYWLTNKVLEIFKQGENLGDIIHVRKGNSTSNNNRFLRLWYETSMDANAFYYSNLSIANKEGKRWIPYNKGGGFRRWYGFQDFLIDWKDDALEIRKIPTSVVTNEQFYMKRGLTWSTITSYKISIRKFEEGFIFDNGGCCIFTDNEELRTFLLGILNSKTFEYIIAGINPTLNFQSGEVSKFPVLINLNESKILSLIEECVELSKKDWNKNEISWEFASNELIRIKADDKLEFEDAIDTYFKLWENIFYKIHQNEETLNGYFIELYGLEEEVLPDVPFEDITILQDELQRESLLDLNKKIIRNTSSYKVTNYQELRLPFISKEVTIQFISYAVGCMLGRFSLDKDGLILASQHENLQDYLRRISLPLNECSFIPDSDNIIPFLYEEWFDDDIVGKFNRFLKVTFGEKNFNKNLAFIEEQIGKDIRKYFIKDFYPDHIKRYKKRPIYWMFSSPKGSFNVLIYMHRYTPDTVSNILNKYLKEFIEKLNTRKEHLRQIQVIGSASDKTKAIKEIDNIEKMLVELHEYERDILYPLATERIEIDLDDGVLVNYNKFGKAVKEVNGLNDPATKKKVKEFDWIDTSQIR